MLSSLTVPAREWTPIEQPMTTELRLFSLKHEEVKLVERVLRRHISQSPYDPRNKMEDIEVVLAKLHLGPTHKHIARGTELRLIGATRRKGDDGTLAIYETPCRIVYVMPEAEYSDKCMKL